METDSNSESNLTLKKFGKGIVSLGSLLLLLSQCPDQPNTPSATDPSSSSSPTPTDVDDKGPALTRLKEILENLTTDHSEDIDEEDETTRIYLPEPETRNQFVDVAVDCLEKSGEFACARDRDYYSTFQCLPLGDYGDEPSVPVQVQQARKMPQWCWDVDPISRPAECQRYLAPRMEFYNGAEIGRIDFAPSSFDQEAFCDSVLDWVHSHPASREAIENHCEIQSIFGPEAVSECYTFQSAWDDFGLNSESIQSMGDTLFDQLDEGEFDFEQNSNGYFTVWIDGVEFPVSLIADRPTTFNASGENPFTFEIGSNEIYLQDYSANTPEDMTQLLGKIRDRMEGGEELPEAQTFQVTSSLSGN